jgi:hypothetical protein
MPRRRMERCAWLGQRCALMCFCEGGGRGVYIELIVIAAEAVEQEMAVHLSYPSACPPNPSPQ